MKKVKICLILSLIMVSLSFILLNAKKEYLSTDDILGVYVNDELSDKIPSKGDALFQKATCDDDSTKVTWDNDNWGLLLSNLNKKVKCNLYFYSDQTVFDFDYTGSVQTFTAPFSGTYKLETWGAQGGKSIMDGVYQDIGGFGGYSSGFINLNQDDILYIYTGGLGSDGKLKVDDSLGGFNGGGNGHWDKCDDEASGGGGGATHIALRTGLLSNLEDFKSDILIVSGGGGGAAWIYTSGNGGGYKGTIGYRSETLYSTNATQLTGYKFGQGGTGSDSYGTPGGGGGGGYYGGYGGYIENKGDFSIDAIPGAGGSGYIGHPLLTNKSMYCYNCEESSEENTKTISTTCNEETPTTNCAKKGNGYARMTLISIIE